jgi:integrase
VNEKKSKVPQSALDAKKSKWLVGRGSATVKIYHTPHGGKNYYTVSYWLEGKRKRQVFTTLQAAKDEAAVKAIAFTNGDLGAAKLTNAESAAFARAVALLEPVGAPLELAASEYASAVKRLGAVSLSQAVDFYLKRHPTNLVPKMVKEVADEMIQLKRSDQLSEQYVKQLQYAMNRFAGRFHVRLCDVRGTDVDAWLRDLGVGPRTRNNLRNSVQALFNFGIARKYLPKDHDEMDAVPVAKDKGGEIEIFTPGEMAQILAVASPEHIPFLAISAFAGVRHAELQRLEWSNVNRKAEIIEIKAGTAKTASRRVIPILPNLAEWLKPHWRESGKICSYTNMVLQLVELTRRVNEKRRSTWARVNGINAEALKAAEKAATVRLAKLTRNQRRSRGTVMPGAETAEEEGWQPFLWKHNALRHSFISYRVADIQNVAQVALEAGNSPQMIFQHYRELVRPAEAKAWFAIVPKDGKL